MSPEQFKRSAEEELQKMEAEFEELRKMVEENRAKIQSISQIKAEDLEHHKGTWKKAVEDWRNKMRLFSQT